MCFFFYFFSSSFCTHLIFSDRLCLAADLTTDQTMKSVTESLEYFLKPEVLDGDNQYCCQSCHKKVDAVKGLKFERLPYLLSLQLKRFDFDYNTFQRIKLNDEV